MAPERSENGGGEKAGTGLVRAVHGMHQALVGVLKVVLVAAFTVLLLDVLWGVFSRYVIGQQTRWTEELAVHLLVWVSLLGAGLTYGEKGHLGVDYFVGKMDPAAQRVAAISVEILVAFFAVFALLYGGTVLVSQTLESGQVSPALGLPMGYVYLAVPISGLLFTAFCIESLAELLTGQVSPRKGPPPTDA